MAARPNCVLSSTQQAICSSTQSSPCHLAAPCTRALLKELSPYFPTGGAYLLLQLGVSTSVLFLQYLLCISNCLLETFSIFSSNVDDNTPNQIHHTSPGLSFTWVPPSPNTLYKTRNPSTIFDSIYSIPLHVSAHLHVAM